MTQLTTAQKIETYLKLRDHKEAANKEFKKSMERVNQAMEVLEGELLKAMQDDGENSKTTDDGTVYIRVVSNMKTTDRDAFLKYCLQNKELDLMDIRPNRSVMKEKMEKGEHVDGVDVTSTQLIGVRKGKK